MNMSFGKKVIRICCGCCRKDNPLADISESTRLLPSTAPKDINDKTEINFFGLVAKSILISPYDISNFGIFTKYHVKKIVFSQNHCLIMFSNVKNELAVFGSNENGQLGLEYKPKIEYNPNTYKEVKLHKYEFELTKDFEFLDISASDTYSLVLIKFIDTKKFGKHNYLYKFGIRDLDTTTSENENTRVISREPIKYDSFKLIKQIYTSETRDLLLLEDNVILLKGTNFDLENYDHFKVIVNDFKMEIKYMCLGNNYCVFFTEAKQIYALGDNEYGELGISTSKFLKSPTLVDFFEQKKLVIKKVVTGARHTLVLTDNNKVYAFGDNSEGQCSGFANFYTIPNKIKFSDKSKIVDIWAGYNHSVGMSLKGEVFSWGDTSSDKLGYRTGLSSQNVPKLIDCLSCKNISYVATGPKQTAIITSKVDQSIIKNYTTI